MTGLTLGPVEFGSFEVPERIIFGGRHRLAVHALPGGGRVVDALGRDDSRITWQGTFSSVDAGGRARLLDELRIEGSPLGLAWGEFAFDVVIEEFEAWFELPNWIPYRIACVPLSPSSTGSGQAVSALIAADLAFAATQGFDAGLGGPSLALLPAALGTTAYANGLASIASTSDAVEAAIVTQGQVIGLTSDFPTVLAAAGALARATAARGYLQRAKANIILGET